MARREFTILAAGLRLPVAFGAFGGPKCEKSGYPWPKAWKIATNAPIARSARGAFEDFPKDGSNGKHQNLVACDGRGHFGGRGGSSAPVCRHRYGCRAAGRSGRDH